MRKLSPKVQAKRTTIIALAAAARAAWAVFDNLPRIKLTFGGSGKVRYETGHGYCILDGNDVQALSANIPDHVSRAWTSYRKHGGLLTICEWHRKLAPRHQSCNFCH